MNVGLNSKHIIKRKNFVRENMGHQEIKMLRNKFQKLSEILMKILNFQTMSLNKIVDNGKSIAVGGA